MDIQDKTRDQLTAELDQLRSHLSALPKREEVWRRLLQSFPNGSLNIFDKELRYLLAEGTGLKHVGLAPEQLVGKTIAEAFPPADTAFVTPFYRRALEGETVEFELPFRKHLYSVNAGPLHDEKGEVYAVIAVAQDITERRRVEETLRDAEQLAIKEYERLLDGIAHLGATLGTARDLQAIFRALREFSVASVPCIGLFISLYDPKRDVRTAVYAWGEGEEVDLSALPPMPITTEGPNSRAVRTGEVVITDDFSTVKHGAPTVSVGENNGLFPQSTLVVPMAVMGRIVGTIEVQSYEPAAYKEGHVTAMRMGANLAAVAIENVRLFEHESRLRAVAEESNRIKDEFLATLSHELRTPLTAMLGWTNMLRGGALDAKTSDHALEIIERNARAQEQIIEDILDVSRIITGKVRLDVRPLRLEPIIKAAIDAARPAADARGIELHLVSPDSCGLVSGDPDRLQQVVWNLLSNAVKFTSRGGRIDITLGCADSHVQIEVKDTGQGISAEFLPYVFDRFRQADGSTTRLHGGLGLGLSIVRQLVELHGGEVRAASPGEGQGTTFTVRLPLMAHRTLPDPKADDSAIYAEAGRLPTVDCPPDLAGLRILIVDDEPDALEYFAAVLSDCGGEVLPVTSAREAMAALAQSVPDVLVSDIGMPGEDGYALIRKVRALPPERGGSLPALALTAYARSEDRLRALAAGFQMHLPKPCEPQELTMIVASLGGRIGRASVKEGEREKV